MEKSWENFWTTGKVEDYLSYRNSVTESKNDQQQNDDRKDKEGIKGTWDRR